MTAAATWSEFEAAEPALAAAGHQLLHQFGGLGLAFISTVRPDGGPRLHPICVVIADGGLFCFLVPSPKAVDLKHDGRFALHAFPPEKVDDEFYISGAAELVENPARRARVDAAYKNTVQEADTMFELKIERALLARYHHRGDWPPTYTKWQAE